MVQPNLDPQTALLTPPIRHKTNIKAPVDVIVNGDVEQVERRESNATIEVDVCSEFTKLTTATTIAEGNHKLCIVGDSDAHPVIFSLGSDHRLYCAWHVPNGNASWQWRDIGPTISNTVVTSFDVLQDNQTKAVHLAVSLAPNLESSSFSDLYLCPNLSLSMILEKLKEALPWYQAKNNCGKQRIQTLCIAPPPPGLDSDHKVFLVVGTRAHDTTMATNYTVSLDPSIETPWKEHSLPTDRSIVIDHAPGRLVGEYKSGIFSLYRVLDDGEPVPQSAEQGTQVRFKSYEDLTTNLVPDLGEIGGTARSITTCANAAGFTDLFIAGKSGVGYWPSGVVSGRPQSILLKGIDIDQVFAHEANRKITVLATSRQGHLYVVEGIRQPPKKKVNRPTLEPFDWIESGVPIRADVQMMATHRNNRFDCSQLVYVSSDRQIYHIVKDPATKLWNEHVLTIPATDKFAEISSYVTQITLTDSDGETLPANYVVELTSSELCFVTVNDRTQELSPKPIMASTDGSGQIRIVTQVGPSLGAPTFTLHLKSSTSNASIHIDPAQRVLRKLLSVTSGSQIRNAKTTTGKAVFKDGQLTEEDANRIADSLKSLPQVLGTADKDCLQRLGPGLNVSTASAISTSGSLSGNTAQSKESNSAPQKGIIEKVFDGIGDVLEAVVRGIVKVARFVWEIVEEVVFFVLEIGKKVFKFVCNTVGPIVRGFANFIAETTGWNGLNTFLDWMGTVFDGENTIKTQTVLVNFVTKGSNLMADAWVSNRPYIDYLIENLRDSIDIPDKRESPPPRESGGGFFATLKKFLGKMFDIIFNNPVVHGILNLVKRLWNAIVEESGIEIPSMQPIYNIFTELASRIGNDLGEQFERLLVDIMSKFSDMLSGKMDLGDTLKTLLGDGFWTLFDILQSFVVHTYDAIPKFIKEVIVYLNGEWKVPLITRLWKFMTDTPLTIMNVLTYPLAFVLNLFTVMMHGKPAFEVWPDPSTFLPPVHKLTAKVPQSNQTTVPILTSDLEQIIGRQTCILRPRSRPRILRSQR
ncbi:hypothetical protein C8J56DRAFT_145750 [Mycena floridula]|nr:hypothetical protein C8J56DRAFT_145750 [Mycena floridula]